MPIDQSFYELKKELETFKKFCAEKQMPERVIWANFQLKKMEELEKENLELTALFKGMIGDE